MNKRSILPELVAPTTHMPICELVEWLPCQTLQKKWFLYDPRLYNEPDICENKL